MTDDLTTDFRVPSVADVEARWLRDIKARCPSIDTTDPRVVLDARMAASLTRPGYSRAQRLYAAGFPDEQTGEALDAQLKPYGGRLPATGSSGAVILETSVGGTNIPPGLTGQINGKTYEVVETGLFISPPNAQVPVQLGIKCTDVGPDTDQPAGSVLTWDSTPPGLLPEATVVAQADGVRGLVGGANEETDAQGQARLRRLRGKPAASGNNNELIDRASKLPGYSVEQAFVIAAADGSGTLSMVATMRRSAPTISRIPTTVERAALAGWVPGKFPASDVDLFAALVSNPVTFVVKAIWAKNATGWADVSPWPTYATPLFAIVDPGTVPYATPQKFRIGNLGGDPGPQPGQTLAFWNPATGAFVRKQVLTATLGAGFVDIQCDTTGGATDLQYTPALGQPMCPWSDSLNLLAPVILAQFNTLGPGEQLPLADIWDPGLRQRRDPEEPEWPYTITTKFAAPLEELPAVKDLVITAIVDGAGVHATPYVTPPGGLGVFNYLTELGYALVFPE